MKHKSHTKADYLVSYKANVELLTKTLPELSQQLNQIIRSHSLPMQNSLLHNLQKCGRLSEKHLVSYNSNVELLMKTLPELSHQLRQIIRLHSLPMQNSLLHNLQKCGRLSEKHLVSYNYSNVELLTKTLPELSQQLHQIIRLHSLPIAQPAEMWPTFGECI